MKRLTLILASVLAFTGMTSAQEGEERIYIPGVLILEDDEFENVYLLGATEANVFYLPNPKAIKTLAKRRADVLSVYIKQPKEFTEALSLFKGRKYTEALEKFRAVAKRYEKFAPLPGNHATLSKFYELECLRNMEDLEGLAAAVADFRQENLVREDQIQQIEVYAFWDAVRQKQWDRLDRLANEWRKRNVPISQRAQIAYCHGLALESLKRPMEALNSYAVAMTADFTKSEVIVRNAVLNSLRVYASLPDVQTAMKLWGTQDEDKFSTGYRQLVEANALARMYTKAGFGSGVALPVAYNVILKYTPEEALAEMEANKKAAKEGKKDPKDAASKDK